MSDGVHRRHGSGARGTGARQVASFAAAAGVMLAVLLGSAPHAGASTEQTPAQQREQVTAREGGETQAIVVGVFAFVLMVGAAGGVLWFTARRRKHH